jgi:hypothetical protein
MSFPSPSPYTPFFRRRIIGRASSPPTWACYEQIALDEDDDCSDSASEGDSCSEDGEDYGHSRTVERNDRHNGDHDHGDSSPPLTSVSESHVLNTSSTDSPRDNSNVQDMDVDDEEECDLADSKKDVKGKQRAVEPEPEPDSPKSRKGRRPRRSHADTLRPILTIHRSQGFVWNQVCLKMKGIDLRLIDGLPLGFVCASVHQRQMHVETSFPLLFPHRSRKLSDIASTSPPNSEGFCSGGLGSTNSPEYEVEVVEIRVQEGELNNIIP